MKLQMNRPQYDMKKMPKGVCYLNNKNIFLKCDLFTDREAERIGKSAAEIEIFLNNVMRFQGVVDCFQEFEDELSALKTDNNYLISRIDRRYRAFLLEARLFLDHWKFYIDSGVYVNHKMNADQYIEDFQNLYNNVTSYEFDNNPNYVIGYVLRNYIAHAEDTICHANINGIENKVFASRDRIMSINLTKLQRAVINKQSSEIDLVAVGKSYLQSLECIQNQLINYMVDEVIIKALLKLLKVRERIKDLDIKENKWMVSDFKSQPFNTVENRNATHAETVNVVMGANISCVWLDWDAYDRLSKYILHEQ